MQVNHIRYLALGGVFGPLTFTLTFLIIASLRPGYSHIHQLISELGATGASYSDLMNFPGFIPSGVMISLFGVSQLILLPKKGLLRIGSGLIILFGIGVAMAGVFSCDEGCPPEGSFENMMHFRISGPSFLCAYAGIFLQAISFRKLSYWRSLWTYSLISSLLAIGFNIVLINSLKSSEYSGAWQRLMLLTIFLWCGIVALRLYRSAKGRTEDKKKRIQKLHNTNQ